MAMKIALLYILASRFFIDPFIALGLLSRNQRDALCTIGSTCESLPPLDLAVDYDSDHFWVPLSWNPCSNECGGGTQTAALGCYASNLTRVSSSICEDLPKLSVEQPCNAIECPSYTVYRSPWSECSKTCGTGYQTREVLCHDNLGSLVHSQHCDLEESYVESQLCNTDACEASYWTLPAWSACDAPCGGGRQKRIPTCHSTRTEVSICTGERPKTEQMCNTQACSTHAWLVGPWKSCPYECEATTDRLVQCVDGYGFEQPDSECPGSKPASTISCDQPHISCSDCLYDCFGHGVCKPDQCSCYDGWTGKYCQTPSNCHGSLGYSEQAKARCCHLVDVNQRCCSTTASLDKDGNCCASGVLDSLGVCDGVATMIDFEGKPCSTIRDEKGLCCISGVLDECHICDGDGTTCSTDMTLYLNVTGFAQAIQEGAFQKFLTSTMSRLASKLRIADEALTVAEVRMISPGGETCAVDALQDSLCSQDEQINGLAVVNATVFPTSPDMVIKKRKDVLAALQPGPLSSSLTVLPEALSADLLFVGDVRRAGVCGNGLCERGERCTSVGASATTFRTSCCLQDCPYVSAVCPAPMAGPMKNKTCSGRGICLEASGQCDCFRGYAGSDCSICAWGWIQTPSGACVMLPDPHSLSKLVAAYKEQKPKPAPTHRHRKGIDASGTVILLALCGVCLALLLLLIVAEHHQQRRVGVHPEPANDPPANGGERAATKWRSSYLGPHSEYDVIPITPRPPTQTTQTIETPPSQVLPGESSRRWSSRRSFFGGKDGTGKRSFRDGSPSELELQSGPNLVTTGEDLTEEEQAKMSERVRKELRGSRSAKFVTGYLTDSEDSDGGDEHNTHCCTPDSPAIVRT
ncbi:hypothetical protein SELMODRAFT_425768 [Selaginella moellendorffii]|uniref:EGF-like domain-containing protein n=1 Tax=Selaginella moellendorffii TaxID=88036 RepID=D8SU81_SELML|nr:hypothetical protein SELMODRAFT_425768 [Selaginella moellendorffii]